MTGFSLAAVALAGVIAATVAGCDGSAPGGRAQPPPKRLAAVSACADTAAASGLEGHLRQVVSVQSPDMETSRRMWGLPLTDSSAVRRVRSDSVCAQAVASYNRHLQPGATPVGSAFVYQVDTLFVVEPSAAPDEYVALVIVLTRAWQLVASVEL
jgi:hypothetical protein